MKRRGFLNMLLGLYPAKKIAEQLPAKIEPEKVVELAPLPQPLPLSYSVSGCYFAGENGCWVDLGHIKDFKLTYGHTDRSE